MQHGVLLADAEAWMFRTKRTERDGRYEKPSAQTIHRCTEAELRAIAEHCRHGRRRGAEKRVRWLAHLVSDWHGDVGPMRRPIVQPHVAAFVAELRERGITPPAAQNTSNRRSNDPPPGLRDQPAGPQADRSAVWLGQDDRQHPSGHVSGD